MAWREGDTLFQSIELERNWLKLPFAAMRSCRSASVTLGAILRATSRETFVPVSTLAAYGGLPVSTVRKHLLRLHDAGWIEDRGRETTRRGWLRRTATIRLTAATRAALTDEGYGVLPRQAATLSWPARGVLSVVLARLMKLKKAVDEQYGVTDEEEVYDAMANLGDWRFSLTFLADKTGLDRKSIVLGKRELCRAGLIVVSMGDTVQSPDLIEPDPTYRFPKVEEDCAW